MSKKITLEDNDIIIHEMQSQNAYRSWITILHYMECLTLEGCIEKETYEKLNEMMISLKQNCRL